MWSATTHIYFNTLEAHTPLPHQLYSETPQQRPDALSEAVTSEAAGNVGGVEPSC